MILNWRLEGPNAPFFLAEDRGFFREGGLAVRLDLAERLLTHRVLADDRTFTGTLVAHVSPNEQWLFTESGSARDAARSSTGSIARSITFAIFGRIVRAAYSSFAKCPEGTIPCDSTRSTRQGARSTAWCHPPPARRPDREATGR